MDYEFADKILNPPGYTHGYLLAKGITIHYTASDSLNGTVAALREKKLAYHIILARDGSAIQMASLNRAVYHAGNAQWKDQRPNKDHLAIAFLSWGKLKGNLSWSGKQISENEIVIDPEKNSWHKISDAQFAALVKFCLWTKISPENIVGHHECCIPQGRKSDPGGSLGMTMGDFRDFLKSSKACA